METPEKVIENKSPLLRFTYYLGNLIDRKCTWFQETIVLPNRQKYYWYHEKVRRVPTVDECYSDDIVCIQEAEEQYKRDRNVDKNILLILKKRWENCLVDHQDELKECDSIYDTYNNAVTNFFIKYGDLGIKGTSISCLMKQKHRMAWERRHGPVGSGKREHVDLPPKNDNVC